MLNVLERLTSFYIGKMEDEELGTIKYIFESGEVVIDYYPELNRIVLEIFKSTEKDHDDLPDYCREDTEALNHILCRKSININGLSKTKLYVILKKNIDELKRLYERL